MFWRLSPGLSLSGFATLIFIGPIGEFHAKLNPAEARTC